MRRARDIGLGLLGWAIFSLCALNLYLAYRLGSLWLPGAVVILAVPAFLYPWLHLRLTGSAEGLLPALGFRRFRPSGIRVAGLLLLTAAAVVTFEALPTVESQVVGSAFAWVSDLAAAAKAPFQPLAAEVVPQSGWLIGLATFALLPALFEETLHRGYLRRIAFRSLPTPVAYLLIAFLFAIAHGRPYQVITLALFSLVLNLTVDLCRSLWPGILLHATNNALLTVPGFGGTFRSSAWLAPGSVGLLLGVGLLVVARRRER